MDGKVNRFFLKIKIFFNLLFSLGICFYPWISFAQQETPASKEDSMLVSSAEAQYDGKEIILTGQVSIQHSIGQISAHRLFIRPSSETGEKKSKLSSLRMSEDVHIQLPEGGLLDCQEAEIDYSKMEGVFLGNASFPDVVYYNCTEKKEQFPKMKPLEVKSSRMTFRLTRDSETSKTLLKQIEALENIRVYYNQDYLILADRAIYQGLLADDPSSKAGLLTLSVNQQNAHCQMTNLNGDHLDAKIIRVDTVDRLLWLEDPSGTLYLRQEKHPTQILKFIANELWWNDHEQLLQLRGKVQLTQNETLHIHTDSELAMAQFVANGKRNLRFIRAPENVQITYEDSIKGNVRKIYCPGTFLIDHEHHKIILHGSFEGLKQNEEASQVYIEDLLGEMYADSVQIDYSWQEGQFVLEKIALKGHVKLFNRFDGHLEESSSILHYGLADHVDYFPKEQELVLASASGNRVLFFDKVNNIQMSAPSLKIKHDAALHKNSIQGMGDVRFTFIEQEFEQIKQRFRLGDGAEQEAGDVKPKK